MGLDLKLLVIDKSSAPPKAKPIIPLNRDYDLFYKIKALKTTTAPRDLQVKFFDESSYKLRLCDAYGKRLRMLPAKSLQRIARRYNKRFPYGMNAGAFDWILELAEDQMVALYWH